jgi:homocysteine S-methyltransferase
MGTQIYAKGIYFNRCFDELNVSMPALIKDIHREYVQAGADIIETNTFAANRLKLAPHGFADRLAEINYKGARIAREVAGDDVYVAGSVGPLGIKIEPWGPTSVDEAKDFFMEPIRALLDGGVDLLIMETFGDLNEIHQAIRAAREIAGDGIPIVAQMALEDDGNSLYGTTPEVFTKRLDEWGADVIGCNCNVGPQVMLECVERMAKATEKKLSAQPNAGKPRNVEGRNIYLCSPEYMAEYAKRFILTGARAVGGCCGTTPAHIKAIVRAVRALEPHRKRAQITVPMEVSEEVEVIPKEKKSNLARKITDGGFVTSVELTPPRGCDPAKIVKAARAVQARGVDVINIPDGPRASARMSAQSLACLLERDAGIETVLHYTCRDRNLLGMQSDLLGAYAMGLKNILLITGDPPKLGTYPDATAVFDVDSIGLTNMVTHLNHGLDLGGNKIGKPTGFFVGVGANPGAINLDYEIGRFEWKVDAGAEFAITQPVFDITLLENFLKRIEHVRIPILAGIWPLQSLRNAEFMNNEVPGASVPPDIMARIRRAEEAGRAREEGTDIAREVVERIRPLVEGVQVSAPFGRYKTALAVIADLLPNLPGQNDRAQ